MSIFSKNKALRELAISKINEGKSRQEAFDEILKESTQSVEEIAKIVRNVPTLMAREKYRIPNLILGILLLLIGALKVLGALNIAMSLGGGPVLLAIFLTPIVNILLSIQVFKYNGGIYLVVILLTIMSVLRSLEQYTNMALEWPILIDLSLIVSVISLSLFLRSKLASNYEVVKKKVKNESGKFRIKQYYVFKDPMIERPELDGNL